MSGRTAKVFLVWQSDLEQTRKELRKCVQKACDQLSKGGDADVLFDSDTRGIAGAVQIDQIVMEKIRTADVVVVDVTPIANRGEKTIPNPNAMVELGFAMATVGLERIIMVRDVSVTGDLPFDIRNLRTTDFESASDSLETMKRAIGMCLEASTPLPGTAEIRRDVARLIDGNGENGRKALGVEVGFLAATSDDAYSLMSQYFLNQREPRPWLESWHYGKRPDNALRKDLRIVLSAAHSATERSSAVTRISRFLTSIDMHGQLMHLEKGPTARFKSTISGGSYNNRSQVYEAVSAWLDELARLGFEQPDLRAAIEPQPDEDSTLFPYEAEDLEQLIKAAKKEVGQADPTVAAQKLKKTLLDVNLANGGLT